MLGWRVIPRIEFGRFSVSPHGIAIAFGYFIGTLIFVRRARARGFDEDHAWNASAISVVGAIIGARVAYIAGHFKEFEGPMEWLQIYRGGISLFGGLTGGFLAAFMYARVKKISFFQMADLGAPGLALGTALGRIGDLVIGDHLGKPTSGWWGWQYKGGELISSPPCISGGVPVYPTLDGCIRPGMIVHQTALYDAVWSLVILAVLLFLDRRPRRTGFLILVWALAYCLGRIVTDFTRVDKVWFGLGLTGSQITAIVVALISAFLLLKYRGAPRVAAPAVPAAPPVLPPTEAPVETAPLITTEPAPSLTDEDVEATPVPAPVEPPIPGELRPYQEGVPEEAPLAWEPAPGVDAPSPQGAPLPQEPPLTGLAPTPYEPPLSEAPLGEVPLTGEVPLPEETPLGGRAPLAGEPVTPEEPWVPGQIPISDELGEEKSPDQRDEPGRRQAGEPPAS